MKAHIITEPRAALLWNFGPQSAGYAGVERAARAFRMKLYPLAADDLLTPVGDLCAGRRRAQALDAAEAEQYPHPAIIISGLRHDNGDLNAFVEALKPTGAQLPIKAAVTPTSKGWTLGALLAELGQEHAALGGAHARPKEQP